MTIYHFHTKFSKHHTPYVPYRFDLDKPYFITPNGAGDGWDIHQLKDDGVTPEKTARAASLEEKHAFLEAWHNHRGILDGHYIMQSVSEEVFPDDIETAQEVH